ncbi:hypothetical protein [Arthrobacter sp. NPDC089319]|uniref:hypothetical protein n=1 Tax=Arthrobacter sp. NPDC089319 TaxID=3155915 RepID=UPI003428E0F2
MFPADHAMAGIPNMNLLKMLDWYGYEQPGHVAFAPISPLTGDDGRTLHRLLDRHCEHAGLDYGAAFALTARSMQLLALVLFNAGDADGVDSTFQMTAEMIKETAALGYGEYRGHLEFMDLIAEQFDFNNHAAKRLNERIKNALDPKDPLPWPPGHLALRVAAGKRPFEHRPSNPGCRGRHRIEPRGGAAPSAPPRQAYWHLSPLEAHQIGIAAGCFPGRGCKADRRQCRGFVMAGMRPVRRYGCSRFVSRCIRPVPEGC